MEVLLVVLQLIPVNLPARRWAQYQRLPQITLTSSTNHITGIIPTGTHSNTPPAADHLSTGVAMLPIYEDK